MNGKWCVCLECGSTVNFENPWSLACSCNHTKIVKIEGAQEAAAIGERITVLNRHIEKFAARVRRLYDAERKLRSERDQYRAVATVAELKLSCIPDRERLRLLQ